MLKHHIKEKVRHALPQRLAVFQRQNPVNNPNLISVSSFDEIARKETRQIKKKEIPGVRGKFFVTKDKHTDLKRMLKHKGQTLQEYASACIEAETARYMEQVSFVPLLTSFGRPPRRFVPPKTGVSEKKRRGHSPVIGSQAP